MSATVISARQDLPTRRPAAIPPLTLVPTGPGRSASEPFSRTRVACTECTMRKGCVTSDFNAAELAKFEEHPHTRHRIRAGHYLYRSGDASHSLFAVRSGFIMTASITDDGREQVTGFHMLGDVIGIDTIHGAPHENDAVALEDSEVCEISLSSLGSLAHEFPSFQRKLYSMIGEQFQREREAMLLLGSMRAEDRLASFLLSLGRRYGSRGFSALRFVLRMSRAEIGSYLGLRIETVSRLFSKFQAEGLLRVEKKSVEILDPNGLKLVIGRSLN